jgi:hypothetical protein
MRRRSFIAAALAASALLALGWLGSADAVSGSRLLLLGGPPGWVQKGAIIDEVFTTSQYYPRPIAQELVDTRASSKFLTPTNGVLVSIGNNVLPLSSAGLLVEPSATNGALQSQNFSATWAGAHSGIATANATTAPDGTTTASKIAYGSATNQNYLFAQAQTYVTSSGYIVYTYAKAADYNFLALVTFDGTDNFGVIYNLSTGAVVGNITNAPVGTITASGSSALANGWYLCWFAFTATNTGSASFGIQAGPQQSNSQNINTPGAGATGSGIYVWGYQSMLGSLPSSYTPTTTSTAPRAADSIVIQRTGIGRIVFTFDNGSTQTISGINPAAQYTIPTNLNRALITRITGYAS